MERGGPDDSVDTSSSVSDQDSSEEEEAVYRGKRNSEGLPHGRGTLTWPNSNRFEGNFQHGIKEGRGCFYFSDGSTLSGVYRSDLLEGVAVYTYPGGRYLEAEYRGGDLNGKFSECTPDGVIISRGRHKNNMRVGCLQVYDEFGGCVMGEVKDGVLTGDNIAYVYPDKRTALVGNFDNGELVNAKVAKLQTEIEVFPPIFKFRTDHSVEIRYDRSSHDCISRQPLVPDPYEQDRVFIAESATPNAGEGLFAKVDLEENETASFYNGVRLTHKEVDARDWALNGNTISLDEDTVIDVPQEYSSTDTYCASLGHKANHSPSPNCRYAPFLHPRFGPIKCVQTLRRVKAGEELTCDYGYEHKLPGTDVDDLPSWFEQVQRRGSSK